MDKRFLYFLPTLLLLALSFSQPFLPNSAQERVVARVIDGDTFDLDNGDRVRLLGIDAPESGQPFFQQATDTLAELVEGGKVKLEKDSQYNKDKYGRLLRYVFVNELFVNRELIRKGLAELMVDENSKYYSDLKQAEEEAKEGKLGIWFSSS